MVESPLIRPRPVLVSRDGFRFCRYSVSVLMWVAVIWRIDWLVAVCAVLMALNALLGIRRAPLVALYTALVQRNHPAAETELDLTGMRFTHTLAFAFITLPLLLVQTGRPDAVETGWHILAFVAAFKTIGALGACPAYKMYGCLINRGNCCNLLRR